MESVAEIQSIDALLPHRGTMLLLTRVTRSEKDSVVAEAQVDPQAWYADAEGCMPVWIGIELMAQAIAGHIGVQSSRAGLAPRPGVLLGAQCYTAHVVTLGAHSPVVITAAEVMRTADGLGAYECRIFQNDVLCADAVIKVFQPEDFPSFIKENRLS